MIEQKRKEMLHPKWTIGWGGRGCTCTTPNFQKWSTLPLMIHPRLFTVALLVTVLAQKLVQHVHSTISLRILPMEDTLPRCTNLVCPPNQDPAMGPLPISLSTAKVSWYICFTLNVTGKEFSTYLHMFHAKKKLQSSGIDGMHESRSCISK